ncbi:MAG: DUF5615 family PIN-like protein [Phycisphaeraceae bacterium]
MIGYYLDINVSVRVAKALRARGIECMTAIDAGLADASDAEHFDYAAKHGLVLVTFDRDFLMLAAQRIDHAGIVFLKRQWGIGAIVKILDRLAASRSSQEIRGQIEYQ